eukprot:CAMPEP_0184650660 /NCGR_PEP_ID=MMETSP0308-20130426/8228_1 /TAXON_ID=38269 /ORGANISM="Gloeochaete witrockiana, Strain SAG 46.84" /LENGTH=459 /DNA_ID=CAMNT_0027084361 /DNA_START=615 /DNA_END=1994 /DNA_ORIENTATION=+
MGRTNDTAVMLGAYLGGPSEAQAHRVRNEIVRYLNLAHSLVYKQAISLTHDDEGVEDLINQGLLTIPEWEVLQHLPNKFNIVYLWVASMIRESAKKGMVYNQVHMVPLMHGNITVMRGAAADVFMYLNTQVPYGYTHVMVVLTRLHLFFITIHSGALIGKAISEKAVVMTILSYIFLIANSMIYEGLLRICKELDNPFGDDRNDFPKTTYQESTRNSSQAVINSVSNMPFMSWFREEIGVGQNSSTNLESKGDADMAEALGLTLSTSAVRITTEDSELRLINRTHSSPPHRTVPDPVRTGASSSPPPTNQLVHRQRSSTAKQLSPASSIARTLSASLSVRPPTPQEIMYPSAGTELVTPGPVGAELQRVDTEGLKQEIERHQSKTDEFPTDSTVAEFSNSSSSSVNSKRPEPSSGFQISNLVHLKRDHHEHSHVVSTEGRQSTESLLPHHHEIHHPPRA